ncbi:MAG: FAD-dependent oxidoreductase [Planctomycetota bacterium]
MRGDDALDGCAPVGRRALLRAAVSGGLAAALGGAACAPRDARAVRRIQGAIVDRENVSGHLLRDRASLGAAAAGSTAGATASPGRSATARVLIVGGGAAGLSVAWRLARAGVEGVVLLELADELGGTSRGGHLAGLAHPWGAHYLPVPRAEQRALSALLVDAGLARMPASLAGRLEVDETLLVRAPDERLFTLGVWEDGLWPRGGGSSGDLDDAQRRRFLALVDELAATPPDARGRRAFDLPLAHTSTAQRGLDGESAKAFAARLGLDGPRMQWWLEYATRDDFGASLEDTSAYALVHYFTGRQAVAADGAATTGEYMTWPEGNARLIAELQRLSVSGGLEVHRGQLAHRVANDGAAARVEAVDVATFERVSWRAEHVVLATPQFVNLRTLAEDPARDARATFRYGPWVVANLDLPAPPPEFGFPRCWDNVRYGSASLGYVDATHQLDRAERGAVWTWYLPVTDRDERAARAALLAAPWEHWRDLVLADLRGPHPDLAERVRRIDVRRFGHAMVRPSPGWLWSGARERAAEAIGRVHFAHTDLSGMALFEEAHWQGTRAAEEVLTALGVESEPLA